MTTSALQSDDASLAFLNRVMERLNHDAHFKRDLTRCLGDGDLGGILTLLDDTAAGHDEPLLLDDAWLEELAAGRGGMPLALVLLAGALGSAHALPSMDPMALSRWSELAPAGMPRPSADDAWLDHALPLIRAFEGLLLEAYLDPVGIATIGYGTTRYSSGQSVQLGDRISAERAEQLLQASLQQQFAPAVFAAIPDARSYSPQQQAALISFTYNVGVGALEGSSLRRRLLAGEPPERVIAEELPRWCRGDGEVLPGLVRRRAAEVALFLGTQSAG